ncbi:MAG: hypothetical protein ACKVJK_02550 [Methylophagaceae bacterium]|jgi:hypothetical protein|tara:strand:- start:9 stop:419 length:411 start_codon:yes stop_codon:yes gene_type:complete
MTYSTATQTAAVLANDPKMYTVLDLETILAEAKASAAIAASSFLDDWNASTGGNDYGEPMYCGFAWVNIYKIKGNTKLGRAMKQAGYTKDYTGAYQIYNPAGYGGQSMDVKEAGARAAALVFTQYGFTAYAGGRAD